MPGISEYSDLMVVRMIIAQLLQEITESISLRRTSVGETRSKMACKYDYDKMILKYVELHSEISWNQISTTNC